MTIRMAVLLTFGVLACLRATAQQPVPAGLLDEIVRNEDDYLASLPSLSAEEAIVSTGPGFPFKRKANAVATMRVRRRLPEEPGSGLIEQRTFVSFEGKPVAAEHEAGKPQRTVDGKIVHLPLTLTGAFGGFAEGVLSADHIACYHFALRPDSRQPAVYALDFERAPETKGSAVCALLPASVRGLMLVDRQSKHLVHFERTIDAAMGRAEKRATFASVDLAPTRVGPDTFWLPTVISAELDGFNGTFVARYANYHRYTGAVTILPGVSTVSEETPQL